MVAEVVALRRYDPSVVAAEMTDTQMRVNRDPSDSAMYMKWIGRSYNGNGPPHREPNIVEKIVRSRNAIAADVLHRFDRCSTSSFYRNSKKRLRRTLRRCSHHPDLRGARLPDPQLPSTLNIIEGGEAEWWRCSCCGKWRLWADIRKGVSGGKFPFFPEFRCSVLRGCDCGVACDSAVEVPETARFERGKETNRYREVVATR